MTLAVLIFHAETSPLNTAATWSIPLMSVTLAVARQRPSPPYLSTETKSSLRQMMVPTPGNLISAVSVPSLTTCPTTFLALRGFNDPRAWILGVSKT